VNKQSVLLTSEGTYPCYGGGVSVWCDYLVRHLPEVQFHVLALTQSPSHRPQFAFPPNVTSSILHPMWGTEEPGVYPCSVSEVHERKLQTGPAETSGRFLSYFERALAEIFSVAPNPHILGESLVGLYVLFKKYDYASCMTSRPAWNAFVQAARRSDLNLSLKDATECMRWLQRYLSFLALSLPRVDLVHSSMAGLAGIPGTLCKLAHCSSFVLTEHGIFLRELYLSLSKSEYSMGARRFLVRFFGAVACMNYRFADVVTTLGEFNRAWQVRCGADPAKIRVVPNGIDPEKFRPRPRLHRSRPTVLTMARIFPLKGIDILIRAAALVRDQIPDVSFRILGEVADPSYHQECLQLIQRFRLASNVSFGETHDAASVYGEADVFCLPSRSEGLPFAVIEAMMCRCPVVAADVGNVADMLSGTGLTFTPNQPDELAAALLRLLSGPEAEQLRDSLAGAAIARAAQHYTIQQFSSRFRDIYKELNNARFNSVLSRAAS
jgi:polysaccharide biosynthesis protein PelF